MGSSKLKRRGYLKISGISNNNLVVKGVFRFCTSITGLPLEEIVFQLDRNYFKIDWVDFCDEAKKSGWTNYRIIQKISDALKDVYTDKYNNKTMGRIICYLER